MSPPASQSAGTSSVDETVEAGFVDEPAAVDDD
jgi:hypothetical protein